MIKNIFVAILFVILLFLAVDNQITKNINATKQYEQRLEECFKQEPRTKDCEFVLWKHNRRYK